METNCIQTVPRAPGAESPALQVTLATGTALLLLPPYSTVMGCHPATHSHTQTTTELN